MGGGGRQESLRRAKDCLNCRGQEGTGEPDPGMGWGPGRGMLRVQRKTASTQKARSWEAGGGQAGG